MLRVHTEVSPIYALRAGRGVEAIPGDSGHQVFHQDFNSDENQDDSPGHHAAVAFLSGDFLTEEEAEHGRHKGDHADDGYRNKNRYVNESETDSHSQGVDAGSHGDADQHPPVERVEIFLLLLAQAIEDHPDSDEGKESEGDPVVVIGDHIFKGGAHQPPSQGEEGLEEGQDKCHLAGLEEEDLFAGHPHRDGNRKGVKTQAQGNHEKSDELSEGNHDGTVRSWVRGERYRMDEA